MRRFEAWQDHLRLTGRADATIGTYAKIYRRAQRLLPFGVEAATGYELIAFLRDSGRAPATTCQYDAALRSFYAWACGPTAEEPLDFDPTGAIPRPRSARHLPRPITDDQLARILASSGNDRFRLWALLAAYGGLRCCEIAGLRREHVTEVSIRILHGKGGKERTVPTHPDVWAAVRDLPPGPLAASRRTGQPLTRLAVSALARAHFHDVLGLPDVTMHRLRHWYGTTVQRRYRNLRVTQELLGHASPSTTAGYAMVADAERAEAVATLPSFMPAAAAARAA